MRQAKSSAWNITASTAVPPRTSKATSITARTVTGRWTGDDVACECGHSTHRRVAMSVPLTLDRPPLYPIPSFATIATVHPDAPYDHDECWCGCCEYREDDELVGPPAKE